jgi:hypothetical protein
MQLASLTLRIAGSLLHTTPMLDVTPAEILVLQSIHGSDAVTDVRYLRDERIQDAADYERLVLKYDKANAWADSPGAASSSLMGRLFPGAMKKLPGTFAEVGFGHVVPPGKRGAKPVADPVPPLEPEQAAEDLTEGGQSGDTGGDV